MGRSTSRTLPSTLALPMAPVGRCPMALVEGAEGRPPAGLPGCAPERPECVVDGLAGDWISWPAPSTTSRGADPRRQVVADGVEAGAVAAGDDELGEGRSGQLSER